MLLAVRRLLISMLLVGLTAGCSPQTQEKPDSATEIKGNASANTLYLYNWNNYISDDTVKRFEAYCKCKLAQDYYSDNEEMLAKLAAGAIG
jgi:spermidine/putrescine transport system substrate-binding protein